MLAFTRLALFALATLSAASDLTADKKKAIVGHGRKGHWKIPGHGMDPPPSSGNATFRQLIDHKNPGLGTFDQTYWWSTQFWSGPGGPVVIMTPGEVNASGYTGYLGNRTLNGAIAQEIGAATIVIEHRYWGFSSPFDDLTTTNLQYLTLPNAIADLTNFANTVQLPFAHPRVSSNAAAVPWVLIGGSYSGALTAWVESVSPGTFWAYLASSAVVEAISDFYTYFDPVQQGMPKNCSSDVSKVIDYMDNILIHGTAQEQHDLKAKFGLESVVHNDDFMGALENGPWLWQSNQFYTHDAGGFFEWCDYIENSVNVTNKALLPGASGVGLTKALDGYAKWWKEVFFPGNCESYGYFSGTYNTECYTRTTRATRSSPTPASATPSTGNGTGCSATNPLATGRRAPLHPAPPSSPASSLRSGSSANAACSSPLALKAKLSPRPRARPKPPSTPTPADGTTSTPPASSLRTANSTPGGIPPSVPTTDPVARSRARRKSP